MLYGILFLLAALLVIFILFKIFDLSEEWFKPLLALAAGGFILYFMWFDKEYSKAAEKLFGDIRVDFIGAIILVVISVVRFFRDI